MSVALRTLEKALREAGGSDDPRDVMRASLLPLIDAIGSAGRLGPSDRGGCANCGCSVGSTRSSYCSNACRQMAAFIRRFRAAMGDGSIRDPERQAALAQALWSLLGGGYPVRQLLIPSAAKARVIARDGGKCQVCGAPATEVDHTEAAIARGSG